MKTLATLLVCFLSLLTLSAKVAADDAAAPTLSLETDPDVPRPSITMGVDPLAYVFGSYGLHLEASVHRYASLSITPAYHRVEGGRGFSLEGAVRVWPFGRGLDWLFVGASASWTREATQQISHAISFGGELGWQVVWKGIAIAAAGGVDHTIIVGADSFTSARVRLLLGYSFM